MNLLIGSRALSHWFDDFKLKDNADWDVITDNHIEWAETSSPEFLNNGDFCKYASNEVIEHNGVNLTVINPIGLAIIKRSHLYRDLSFDKRITHYHKHLKSFFIKNSDYDNRVRLTKEMFKQPHPKLNVPVEDFFDDYVVKKYNHDYLHELVAYNNGIPLYKALQDDPSSAWCHKSYWDRFTHTERIRCVAEEAMVIALERFIIPNNWDYIFSIAYHKAVVKICTTLCSGYFRDFAIDNYPEVLSILDKEKFLKVKQILKEKDNGY